MMTVETISKRLIALGDVIRIAIETVAADDDAPEALLKAVHDLTEQHREMKNRSKQADPRVARELVHLLEAVADRAKHEAQEADGIADGTRQAVIEAHEKIAALAAEVEAPAWRT
jgi:hypothetical protein